MYEVICGTIFKSQYYYEWCENVLREISETKYGIRMPRGTKRAKRYVVYKLAEYNVLVKKRPKLSENYVWVLNETWFNKLRAELDSLKHVDMKPAKLTVHIKKQHRKWGRQDE